MKTSLFFIAAVSLLFLAVSCGENDTEKNQQDQLVGVWKLSQITGGFAGHGYPADFTTVEFKNNNQYLIENQDTVKGTGIYRLEKIEDKLTLQLTSSDASLIGFEQYPKEVIFDKEKLYLSDPCCDLFVYEFGQDGN